MARFPPPGGGGPAWGSEASLRVHRHQPRVLIAVPLASAHAQLPRTRLYSISPTGAKAGSAVDVTLASGTDLDEVDKLHFSHPGITAVLKAPNVFTVTVDPNVPPGSYDVLASGLFGISNPRTFVVGTLDETQEVEPNNVIEEAKPIELGKTLNGVMNAATDVDFFKFAGKKDQRILAACTAQHIDSRLEAKLELYAADGRRIAEGRNDDRGDPLIDATLPADGDYILKLYDFQFRGGAEYFYRLARGQLSVYRLHRAPFGDRRHHVAIHGLRPQPARRTAGRHRAERPAAGKNHRRCRASGRRSRAG